MIQPDETHLLVDGGPKDMSTIPLSDRVTLGRLPANNVVVTDPGVSHQHAAILPTDEGFYLRDLSSSNGTFVNRRNITVEDHLLRDGDRIQLGPSEVTYVFRSPAAGTQRFTLIQPAVQLSETAILHGREEPARQTGPALGQVEAVPNKESALPEEEELYEGTVRLNLQAEGNLALVLAFTQQLRERPAFRLLRLSNNPVGGVDIWLGLRESLSLRLVFNEMERVAESNLAADGDPGSETQEPVLNILLKAAD